MEYDTNTMARAKMTNVVVSPKDSREVSAALRGKSVAAGLALLADVKEKKRAIRYTRYNSESAGHRTSVPGPGRYPLKAAIAFEELLRSARANAEFKDLEPELLRIVHIKADQAATPFRYGRHRGRQGKRAHIEVIVREDEKLKKTVQKQTVSATKQKATSAPKDPKKTEAKKTTPTAEPSKPETKAASAKTESAKSEPTAETASAKSEATAETAAAQSAEAEASTRQAPEAAPAKPPEKTETAPDAQAPSTKKSEATSDAKPETKPDEKAEPKAPKDAQSEAKTEKDAPAKGEKQ